MGCLGCRAPQKPVTTTSVGVHPLPLPPSLPPLFRPPPVAPRAILLPSVGIGGFPAALAQGAVALRDVLVSGGPGVSAEAREGEEAAARGTRERKIHREMLVISLRRRF